MNEDKTLELDKETIKAQVEQARKIADALEKHERENKRLWIALLCAIAALLLMAGSAVYAVSHAQAIANEAMLNALNTVAEIGATAETSTTTVTQDTGEGSGNNVYLQENGTYNESGAE